ncbi:hypothetical protein CMUS01_00730 [Colletotrichum musicola]|uniref:Uncharacterized protein n=1 Tax=Colletotrichum musicola TaxID=2175873 RepID=A0A8H6U947_9PEZI|nr:hypothetical protein CMUS01_00730 [Colletotrichum musicola]
MDGAGDVVHVQVQEPLPCAALHLVLHLHKHFSGPAGSAYWLAAAGWRLLAEAYDTRRRCRETHRAKQAGNRTAMEVSSRQGWMRRTGGEIGGVLGNEKAGRENSQSAGMGPVGEEEAKGPKGVVVGSGPCDAAGDARSGRGAAQGEGAGTSVARSCSCPDSTWEMTEFTACQAQMANDFARGENPFPVIKHTPWGNSSSACLLASWSASFAMAQSQDQTRTERPRATRTFPRGDDEKGAVDRVARRTVPRLSRDGLVLRAGPPADLCANTQI